jgi:hypothetical protein
MSLFNFFLNKKISCIEKKLSLQSTSNVVQNIAFKHTLAPNHKKRKWLSLIANEYTAEELKEHGFQISNKSLANARRYYYSYGPGMNPPNPEQPASKRKKDDAIQRRVN